MSVPMSVDELFQLIRKSGMIDERKLTAYYQRRLITRGFPDDARDLAGEMVRDGILTYFQAEQFLLGKWRGFTIGKYKLLERIGVGGMGQVFLCEHMFLKKRVAVKILPPAKAEHPGALGRFYREARAAGSLDHPNIVRTHDIDQDGNLHFIVMDYVDGSNLLDVVKRFGPLDVRRAVSYVRQVAQGLDYAFRNKIIHRDIKPGNILIDRRGAAFVLDMGLARFLNDHTDQLTIKYDDKIVLGTADYVAPEQVANSHAVDIRADIYALGATFYFLLAGHPPFPSGTVSQKLLWHRTKEPMPIRSIRPELPHELASILAKMMAKDPKARYQTPAQVVSALEAWSVEPVPLPHPDEMPVLSPAALEGSFDSTPQSASELVLSGNATEMTNGLSTTSTAVLAESRVGTVHAAPFAPQPRANPFGTVGNNPWEIANDGSEQPPTRSTKSTPLPSSSIPTRKRQPSGTEDCFHTKTESRTFSARPTQWALIAAGVVVLAVTIALVISNL